jgi:hypothetical protein
MMMMMMMMMVICDSSLGNVLHQRFSTLSMVSTLLFAKKFVRRIITVIYGSDTSIFGWFR